MYSQGPYFYEQQPRRYTPEQYSSSDGGWYGAGSQGRYPTSDSSVSSTTERQVGPLGDLYSVVDRSRDRSVRSDIGVIPNNRLQSSTETRPVPVVAAAAGQHIYDLEHLATFSAIGNGPGQLLSAHNGIGRVREMARTGAIWPLKVKIVISDRELAVIDFRTGEEMEHFPLALISEPTSAMAANRRSAISHEPLDNIVLFTVLEDPVSKSSPPEMHVFQCISQSGQSLVDDILAAKAGKLFSVAVSTRGQIHQRSAEAASYDSMLSAERAANAASRYQGGPQAGYAFRQSMKRDGWEPGAGTPTALNDAAQRGVTLLDRCFSDIEQFVLRIQQAAKAFKELDTRKSVRVNKNTQQLGDGLLGMRARPPPVKDFIDILQKFKLSFVLLAKLKSHIRDPNAPELVHFLFTPLALVVDAACGDSQHGNSPSELGSVVVTPLPTPESHELLDNCLTSKESELLRSLGPAWTTSIDKWRWEVPPYMPRFYDGWQPPAFWLEEIGVPAGIAVTSRPLTGHNQYQRENGFDMKLPGQARSEGSVISSLTDQEIRNIELERKLAMEYHRSKINELSSEMKRTELNERQPVMDRYQSDNSAAATRNADWDQVANVDGRYRPPGPDYEYSAGRIQPDVSINERVRAQKLMEPFNKQTNYPPERLGPSKSERFAESSARVPNEHMERSALKSTSAAPVNSHSSQQDYVQQLRARGAKICKVTSDRESKNPKELGVKLGELIEVLEDNRNWWKVSNIAGKTGYVPKTILVTYLSSN